MMRNVMIVGCLLVLLTPHISAYISNEDTDQGWHGSEDLTSSQHGEEGEPWSPSLQREMAGIAVTEDSVSEDAGPLEADHWRPLEALGPPEMDSSLIPIEEELSQRTRAQLDTLSRSAHLAQPRFGIEKPLDPLVSSSSLKYVHEGDLLKLRLVLDNLTLEGISSLSVQEVTFQRGQGGEEEEEEEIMEVQPGDDVTGGTHNTSGRPRNRRRRNGRRTASSKGVVRVAFSQMVVRAKYQVRGSAGGFLTFRESGNLTLTAPSVFVTSRLSLFLPPPHSQSRSATPHRRHGGRVKVVRVRSEVSSPPTNLIIHPAAHPPRWVRQQVQTKLEELSKYLSHQHGAVRRLLHLWGKLLKRLIHRTARAIA